MKYVKKEIQRGEKYGVGRGGGDRGVPELPAPEEPRHRQGGLVGQEGEDHRSR